MSLGPVMLDLVGTTITPAEREMLLHPQTGGVILFSRNYESLAQLQALLDELHALRNPRLIVAVDHEGGRVQRFRDGFTEIPAMAELGALYDRDKKLALDVAQELGWLMAAELRAVGVDISFAPVLDLHHGMSGVIGDRSFHKHPEIVATIAHRFIMGMREAGMAATGKHFPGHGGVKEDSHVAKPVDKRDLNDLRLSDMIPFERLVHYGLAGIMPAHVVYESIDPLPAGYSKFWLQDILRRELGFDGVIFSDDLSMDGADLGNSYGERAHLALDAGCDMVLVCNHPEAAMQVLRALKDYENPVAQWRLIRLHGRPKALNNTALHKSTRWQAATKWAQQLLNDPNFELAV
ncbi:MAG: beta-N-acetylhexosaminidase [Gammaproteobacteria bacterium]|nr:beta-N-acetylhexosaminidase [Gammaproteobacteria bacterium]